MPGSVLGAGDAMVNKKGPRSLGAFSLMGGWGAHRYKKVIQTAKSCMRRLPADRLSSSNIFFFLINSLKSYFNDLNWI